MSDAPPIEVDDSAMIVPRWTLAVIIATAALVGVAVTRIVQMMHTRKVKDTDGVSAFGLLFLLASSIAGIAGVVSAVPDRILVSWVALLLEVILAFPFHLLLFGVVYRYSDGRAKTMAAYGFVAFLSYAIFALAFCMASPIVAAYLKRYAGVENFWMAQSEFFGYQEVVFTVVSWLMQIVQTLLSKNPGTLHWSMPLLTGIGMLVIGVIQLAVWAPWIWWVPNLILAVLALFDSVALALRVIWLRRRNKEPKNLEMDELRRDAEAANEVVALDEDDVREVETNRTNMVLDPDALAALINQLLPPATPRLRVDRPAPSSVLPGSSLPGSIPPLDLAHVNPTSK